MRRSILQFSLFSVVTLVVLGALTALLSHHIAREESRRDARSRSEDIADVAAQLVGAAVRMRDEEAMLVLDTAMERRLRYGSISHILLWDADGRILWADDDRLVGRTYALPDELEELVLTGGSAIDRDASSTEHPGREPDDGSLVEVYVSTSDADGMPFLFEAYVPAARVDQDYRAILRELLPMTLGVLLLMQVATLPLSISLARRIDRVDAHRSSVLTRSLQSWHAERRGIAQDLHDTVVQDLSAISYALPAVIGQLPDHPSADAARATGHRMGGVLQRSLSTLRSMLVDLSPDGFDSVGLVAALESLRNRAADSGLTVSLRVEPGLDLDEASGGLVYRVVREGLRNVVKHAGADTVVVDVRRAGEVVEVVVTDDGRGPSSPVTLPGHDGLRLLGQVVRDTGGTLQVGEARPRGTTLRVTIPAGPRPGHDPA